MTKRKLELAKARQEEEGEMARSMHEMNARRELRKLEEEVAIAEVIWRVEYEFDEEASTTGNLQDEIKLTTPFDYLPKPSRPAGATASHSTPKSNLTVDVTQLLQTADFILWS